MPETWKIGQSANISFFTYKDMLNHELKDEIVKKEENVILKNEKGNEQILAWNKIPIVDGYVITSIGTKEILNSFAGIHYINFYSSLILLTITFFISLLFSRMIIKPVYQVKKAMDLLRQGIFPKKLKIDRNDEYGSIKRSVNEVVKSMQKLTSFANHIGQGNFNSHFQPTSEKDMLGNALLQMRTSLRNAEEKDNIRNWIVSGKAELAEVLRSSQDLVKLGDNILNYLCSRIEAAQGAFYVLNNDNSQPILEMQSCYAYSKKKFLNIDFKITQGLVGQAAAERASIYRTEIPPSYSFISTGLLGDAKPDSIFLVPLVYNDDLYGVIELASINGLRDEQRQFIEEVSIDIASTIFNIKVNSKTQILLRNAQQMSKELQSNAIEMEEAQQNLSVSNEKLELQIKEVNNASKRQEALLQNASEVITIYDNDGKIKYISPSLKSILGYEPEEVVGNKVINKAYSSSEDPLQQLFDDLQNNFFNTSNEFKYLKRDGDKVWLMAQGVNLLDDDAIKGIVINFRDITIKKLAEQEQKKSGQMQSLSENSPDLIARITIDHQIFYINQVIECYTGQKTSKFLNKYLGETPLPKELIESWTDIIKKLSETQSKDTFECDYIFNDHHTSMSISVIPEFEEGNLVTFLFVAHDITERKKILKEIQDTNRKINDSITYAERIQGTILPDEDLLDQEFRDALMFFRPKDTVSGDFPWFYKSGNDMYVATVDCTGHGVPGAMISLVGYFLLDNIMEHAAGKSPGLILDLLNELVTKTFDQNSESSKLKDGMDIAMTKVNLTENSLEYAGAHRPLYFIRNNQITEIKGNKFPIGGGKAYKTKTEFTNSKIKLEKDDRFFFFTDGLRDQFGGERNKKFSNKRIKEILLEDDNLDITNQKLELSFLEWKGERKQTDDILIIGIQI